MTRSLVGKRDGRCRIRWGRLCYRAPVVGLLALILFMAGTVSLVALAGPRLQMWWAEHLWRLMAAFVALGLLLGIVAPLIRGWCGPAERLADLDAPADQAEAEGLAAWLHTWRYFFGALALVGLVALWYAEEDWRGRQLWEHYQLQLAARGKLVSSASLIPPQVPDDQNFAMTPFLAPLFGGAPPTSSTNGPLAFWNFTAKYDAAGSALKTAKSVRSNSWFAGRIDLRAWHAAFLSGPNRFESGKAEVVSTNLSQAEAAAGVLAALAGCEPVFEELRVASRLPHSRFDVAYASEDPASVLLPHLSAVKGVCRVLQLHAIAELGLGRTDAAHNDLELMFNLTDATRDEPLVIAHLVRLSELSLTLEPLAEGLAGHQWSEPQLVALQERLRRFDLCADVKHALQGERVLFSGRIIEQVCRSPNRYRTLVNLGIGNMGGAPANFDPPTALLTALPSGWLYLERLNYDRVFDQYLLAPLEAPGVRIQLGALRKAEAGLTAVGQSSLPALAVRHQFLSALLLPSLARVLDRTAFTQTAADSATLACALERYRLAHGEFPQNLEGLVPRFIDRLPCDLIDGQPLRYRRTDDGQYVLYSVGSNETDDGGLPGLNSSGEAVDRQKGDWVWRLPARL